jgi:hypothetical protein
MAAAGIFLGLGVGAFGVLVHTLWPVAGLVAFFAFTGLLVARRYPDFARLWRWWALPAFAVASGIATAIWLPPEWALALVVSAVFAYVLWFVVYAIMELKVDPSGKHDGGWQ